MSEERQKQKGFRERIMGMLPESLVKKTARKEIGYEEAQRRAIAEAENGRGGVDSGEAGKSWDETFPKRNE